MRPIGARETQKHYVERVLLADGHISTYGALYELRDEDGRPRSITRLAAIIEPLRKSGWTITTRGESHELATYVLISSPLSAWRCTTCGSEARGEPAPLLGGMGEAFCFGCSKSRLFARRAA